MNMKKWIARLMLSLALLGATAAHAAEPLKIGYSDWPGWVAWQVAISMRPSPTPSNSGCAA